MSETVIKFENVSKKYCKSIKRTMLYGMSDITRNVLGMSSHPELLRKDEFLAVDNVSFEVKKGESLGLVGTNGSGKTTALKMLNGIFWPDAGRITVKGRVGALIAVGAGFHPLLTGRENIFINGAILGMGRKEMQSKVDSIVEFAGLKDFLDVPVKHYSSGMFVRLGFAVAIHCDPDILLVDEVLAVGDARFQAKCINKMKEIEKNGTTIVYVSHNLNSVYLMCEKCLYISNGKVLGYGATRDILNSYKQDILRTSEGGDSIMQSEMRYGTEEVKIKKVVFTDGSGVEMSSFKRGQPFEIRMQYQAFQKVDDAEFSIIIYSSDGTKVTQPTTRDHGFPLPSLEGEGEVRYKIRALPLGIGRYTVSIGIWDPSGFVAYDTHERIYEFFVEDGDIDGRINERMGLVYLPAEWEIGRG